MGGTGKKPRRRYHHRCDHTCDLARLCCLVCLQALPVASGERAGIDIRFPGMRVWAVHRTPSAAVLRTTPHYGDWLDVYCTVSRPLVTPVAGLLAPSYASSSSASGQVAAAAAASATSGVTVAAVSI